jgi:hypothetical protein
MAGGKKKKADTIQAVPPPDPKTLTDLDVTTLDLRNNARAINDAHVNKLFISMRNSGVGIVLDFFLILL